MKRAVVGVLVMALVSSATPVLAGKGGTSFRTFPCRDSADVAHALELTVDGETATGHYAVPDEPATGLVVFAHGYGHTSFSWTHHMRTAADHGLMAVGMDYRGAIITSDSNGDGLPESRGWNVMKGARDSIAVAQAMQASCPAIEDVTIFGVSMGGNTSGLAVALQGAEDITDYGKNTPLFDHWFDIEGAVNMIETYAAARAIAPANGTAKNAHSDIVQETGGEIEENPQAFRDRSVVARMDDVAAAGLEGVVVIHGLDDGLVPYNQGREMSTLLAINRIPTDMYTVGRKSKESERETTITGYAMDNVDKNWRSPLAGHASEKSTKHIIMVTAFERLWDLYENGNEPGSVTGYREYFVDGEAGTFPGI